MENLMVKTQNQEGVLVGGEFEPMDLPPGFRFHPTDEELITYYLYPKVVDNNFSARAIGEVDLNKCEPWDLPRKAKMGEKEGYFFVLRDRKYPTGLRTNRATEKGYWKATGKDKEILRGKILVGMKKTLVFYKGRAPKGEKSNWVMHEYRLEGKASLQNLPSTSKGSSQNEWVICRVFQKNAAGKKIPFPGLIISDSFENDYNPSGNLPPLMECSPYKTQINYDSKQGEPNVPCFSNPMGNFTTQTSHIQSQEASFNGSFINNNNPFSSFSSTPILTDYSSMIRGKNPIMDPQTGQYSGNYSISDNQILQAILKNHHGTEMKQSMKTEAVNYSASQDTGCLSSDMNAEISNYETGSTPFDDLHAPSTCVGLNDFDDFWNC